MNKTDDIYSLSKRENAGVAFYYRLVGLSRVRNNDSVRTQVRITRIDYFVTGIRNVHEKTLIVLLGTQTVFYRGFNSIKPRGVYIYT